MLALFYASLLTLEPLVFQRLFFCLFFEIAVRNHITASFWGAPYGVLLTVAGYC